MIKILSDEITKLQAQVDRIKRKCEKWSKVSDKNACYCYFDYFNLTKQLKELEGVENE